MFLIIARTLADAQQFKEEFEKARDINAGLAGSDAAPEEVKEEAEVKEEPAAEEEVKKEEEATPAEEPKVEKDAE